jgi:hypothetical protein
MFLLHSKKSNKSLEKFKYFGMAVGNQNYIRFDAFPASFYKTEPPYPADSPRKLHYNQNYIPEEVKSIWDSQNVQILAYFRDLP